MSVSDNNKNNTARELNPEELEMVTGGSGLRDLGINLFTDDKKMKTDKIVDNELPNERSNRPITLKA